MEDRDPLEGVYLTFPVGKIEVLDSTGEIKTKKAFISRDIEDMSAEEFIEWIKFTYPGGLKEENSAMFESLSDRVQIFQIILSFWTMWNTVASDTKK